jgi:hypothetical protein
LGGEGFNIDWTPERRLAMSIKLSKHYNLPENIEKNRATQLVAQKRPDVVKRKSDKAKIVMNLPGDKRKK